jgi:hypothetical protein
MQIKNNLVFIDQQGFCDSESEIHAGLFHYGYSKLWIKQYDVFTM